jgi:hypothetical protein
VTVGGARSLSGCDGYACRGEMVSDRRFKDLESGGDRLVHIDITVGPQPAAENNMGSRSVMARYARYFFRSSAESIG